MTHRKEIYVWAKLIVENYGETSDYLSCTQVLIIVPIVQDKKSSNVFPYWVVKYIHGQRQGQGPHVSGKSDVESEDHERSDYVGSKAQHIEASVSGSVSSSCSAASDANSVKEFKASLYERKEPFTVNLLKYTIWLLYLVLFAACVIDWVMSNLKADQTQDFFDLERAFTERLDMISLIALDTRTEDLLIRYGCVGHDL